MTTTAADSTAPAEGEERSQASEPGAEAPLTEPEAAPPEHIGHGYAKQKDQHLKRLRRIEGQIRGLQRMVEEDVYCIDILTQVSASTKALQSFALQLLEEHLRHCVAAAAVKGGEESDTKVAEATAAIARLLRT
ncbi:metal-sensitive transcriptional regulator [Streptomyces sp. ME19-01-6]|uniref:metal-sensitive transcriptional regulator n=1 Tax=Streptomyces sp. ME19-01-6 TaxID=3028686 RepID=UPI0029BDAC9F|nr:metal-sensitive transcriptional regulator [Streptomyces sp. ME19-01-6]MDX3233733.1 metal-sensitive transcriptional regulator [Streptomyces sp. ME19-01-6]